MIQGIPQVEFMRAVLGISSIMLDDKITREDKRKTLCKAVEELSEDAFVKYIPEIIVIINKKRDVSSEYEDSEKQLEGVLEWLPRMRQFSEMLLEIIKERRKRFGLKI